MINREKPNRQFVRALIAGRCSPEEIYKRMISELITVDQLIKGLHDYLLDNVELPACLIKMLQVGWLNGQEVKEALDHYGLEDTVATS